MNVLNKTYDPKEFEKEVYCRTEKFFDPCALSCCEDEFFSLLMPPPNVTGSLHVGHALTYTIQDILVRYYRQNGKKTLWQPGVDHAGIATQMVVEKMLEAEGVQTSSLSRDEFVQKAFEWKKKSGDMIVSQQKRIGCSASWGSSRFTMDAGFSAAVARAFVLLHRDGLIYRDKRLVNWDVKFRSAISDLEIQNKEENGKLWYIKYPIAGESGCVVVATSRPETMFGDVAVAVHPEDTRYSHLVGKKVVVPLILRTIPIVADRYADMEKGTGCVKITPAHDYNDFAVGKRHGLGLIRVLDEKGCMACCQDVPEELHGVFVKKARKLTLKKLMEVGSFDHEEEIVHTVPYGDRSGAIVEPMLTDQWFLDSKALSLKAVEAVLSKKVRFYPEKWENTFFEWMRNIEPWCISRQIVWGHQIPAWFGPSGEIIVAENEQLAFEQALAKNLNPLDLRRETDVLDTWFSSALWPFVTLGWPEKTKNLEIFYPTSVLVTGFDIIFFWVARMMMMSTHFMNDVPFKDIYVHALVRDDKGQKMSKSKGNVIDPLSLMDEFGADALRFTMAFLSVPGVDLKLSKENVKISRNFITKIWNAARFLQFNGVLFDQKISDVKIDSKLCNWIVAKLKKFQEDIDQNIKEYRFDFAARNIQFFLRDCYCDFFVEVVKIVDGEEIRHVAGAVFAEFLRITHPFIPFVTDHLAEILQNVKTLIFASPKELSLVQTSKAHEKEVDEFLDVLHQYRSSSGDEELHQRLLNWPGELQTISKLVQ